MVGQTLAHYKILEKIGSGGMGDVYLAEDTKLDRKVALKVLPPELAESEMRRARFKREAKAIAALDHPNIVHVYSVEEADGIHFITMQLVHGKTLTELLPKNGFPLNKFFEIAIPLADAVAAAHQEGITHRDLKPDNMMVTDEGRIKVLDFGLAKPTSGFVGGDADSALPTAAKTAEGVIVGTLNYMSPEQAQGKTVDARSDIFSLGVVFYEMLTGRRPFGGETPAEVLSAIIKDTPRPVAEARTEIPRELSKMVGRCLAREPTRRLQSALDVRNELEELKADLSSGELQERIPARRPSVNKWLVAATFLVLVAILVYVAFAPEEARPRLLNPVQVTSVVGVENHPTWSPDGGRLAYESNQNGNWDIWVAQVGGGEPVNLTADHDGVDRYPSWSPDGRHIAFLSQRDEGWGLYTMSALGGSLRKLVSVPVVDQPTGAPRWSADGSEIVVPARAPPHNFVEIVSLQTRETRRIPLPEHEGHGCYDLGLSPDGRTFVYVEANHHTADITRLWVVPASGGEPIPMTDGFTKDWSPTWSTDGRDLYFVSNRGGSMDLWQQRVGEDGTPEGEPAPLSTGLGIRSVAFSLDGGKLAYSRGRRVANVWRVPILHDRRATWAVAEQLTFDTAEVESLDVSLDGKRLVVSSDRAGNEDVWILPSEGGEMTQLTTDPMPDWFPRWSPDGKEVAFFSYRSGNRDVWVMTAEGGPARQLTFHPGPDVAFAWSPDGQEIAFTSMRGGKRDIWILAEEAGEPRQLTVHPDDDFTPDWSPDGKWIAVRRATSLYRIPAAGGEAELLTEGPGSSPRFSPDGRVLYYTRGGERAGNLWALSLEDGSEHPVTDLEGRKGALSYLATDGRYLYFVWQDDLGDIWVMDVVTEEE